MRFLPDLPGGRNSRMDPLQAAILTARLPFLEDRNVRRRGIASRYRDALTESPDFLHGAGTNTAAHHAVVVTERRQELRVFLDERGIHSEIHYPYTLGEMPALAPRVSPTPVADALTQRILSVPCFPEMTADEVDRVVAALREWAGSAEISSEMVGVGTQPGDSSV